MSESSHHAPPPIGDRLKVLAQHALPKLVLTRFGASIASARAGIATTRLIEWFIRRYRVNMAEAEHPDAAHYASFNTFFTRALKPGARPLAKSRWVCPVDGAISQCGDIVVDQIFQAKGHHFSTTALLGGDPVHSAPFEGGSFATLYLSPKDYHRIHMPVTGRLTEMIHVPGSLYSVNPVTARGVPGLFARNERVVCLFDTAHGPLAMVLVGATIVGSMATTWHGVVNPPRPKDTRRWRYEGKSAPHLKQGEEMGRFLLGSTVVLLIPKDVISWPDDWLASRPVRMGEAMHQTL